MSDSTKAPDSPAASPTPDPEPALPDPDPPYTAWHHLLIQILEGLLALFGGPALLTIKPFFKLGTLPLEADLIVLLKHVAGPALAEMIPEFAFMLRHLAWLTVVEYKGPSDRLTMIGFNTALTYAFMARQKHLVDGKLPRLSQMCLQMLYSHKERGLLDELAEEGFSFVKVETGILRCDKLTMPIFLMDLAQLADQDPAALINLLSSRHRRFTLLSKPDPARRALEENLYYTVFKELQRMLSQEKTKDLPGAREVLADLSELRRQFIASLTPEERLQGLRPEERLQGLGPEERARLRALLSNGSSE
jgi:hypothetical protein